MANGHGGRRKGSGRKKGRTTKPIYVPDPDNLQPLDFMLEALRNVKLAWPVRMDAAKAAAPYCHARLAQTDLNVDGDLTVELVSYLDNDTNPKP